MTLQLAYIGDDFTGSTDALEQLVRGGVPTALFTNTPPINALAAEKPIEAIGIATASRTASPAEMDVSLDATFRAVAAMQPRFVHYKVCSTFDSSPNIGSIGRAIDIGARVFCNRIIPLVVGAPSLQRFCVFGNLFARSGLDSPPFRLDRHPTMSRHPSTPMDEADLRAHLSRQTDRPIELVDVLTLDKWPTALFNRLVACPDGSIVLFDVLTNAHLATIGAALVELQRREGKPQLVVGSSAIEAALTNRWQTLGQLEPADLPQLTGVDRLLAVSGSCSPVTERQIAYAVVHGFVEIALDASALVNATDVRGEAARIAERATAELVQGRSVIMHTSRGAVDSRVRDGRHSLSAILGTAVRAVLRHGVDKRVAIAGGDTSHFVAISLGIESLELVALSAPGAPLCRAHSSAAEVDGVEFAFKGGQVGHDDYFVAVRDGARSSSYLSVEK
jgi:3-oxoisoapionate kinase